MFKIDLNCDLGEGAKHDADIIPLITSANIACGFHAGDLHTMADSGFALQKQQGFIGCSSGICRQRKFRKNSD